MVPFSQVRPIPIYFKKRLKCVLNHLSDFRPLFLWSWWFAQDIRLEIAQQKQLCPPLQIGIIFAQTPSARMRASRRLLVCKLTQINARSSIGLKRLGTRRRR